MARETIRLAYSFGLVRLRHFFHSSPISSAQFAGFVRNLTVSLNVYEPDFWPNGRVLLPPHAKYGQLISAKTYDKKRKLNGEFVDGNGEMIFYLEDEKEWITREYENGVQISNREVYDFKE